MLTRRETLAAGLGASALVLLPGAGAATEVEDWITAFTGGAPLAEEGVILTLPAVAENGGAVPVAVTAPGAVEILLVATGNPTPGLGRFAFGPAAGAATVATRIRLARTQEVVAVARLPDGRFRTARATVEVTVGGCAA